MGIRLSPATPGRRYGATVRLIRPVLATLVVMLLVACGSDDEPPPEPPADSSSTSSTSSSSTTESPSPSETAAPEPTPPPLPPLAANPDDVGAAAFVRHWFDLANYAYATGDTAPLKSASEADCQACSDIIGTIDEQHSDGGSFRRGLITVTVAEAPAPDESGVVLVSTQFSQDELDAFTPGGELEDTTPAALDELVGFVIAWVDGGWLAAGIGR